MAYAKSQDLTVEPQIEHRFGRTWRRSRRLAIFAANHVEQDCPGELSAFIGDCYRQRRQPIHWLRHKPVMSL